VAFPAGLLLKYDLPVPVLGQNHAPVALFLQYPYQEHGAYQARGGFHQIGAGVWLQMAR
jgi:hypothetical protein